MKLNAAEWFYEWEWRPPRDFINKIERFLIFSYKQTIDTGCFFKKISFGIDRILLVSKEEKKFTMKSNDKGLSLS